MGLCIRILRRGAEPLLAADVGRVVAALRLLVVLKARGAVEAVRSAAHAAVEFCAVGRVGEEAVRGALEAARRWRWL